MKQKNVEFEDEEEDEMSRDAYGRSPGDSKGQAADYAPNNFSQQQDLDHSDLPATELAARSAGKKAIGVASDEEEG